MQALNVSTLRQQRVSPLAAELTRIFDALDDSNLIERMWRYRWTGRRGFDPLALWHAVLAAH